MGKLLREIQASKKKIVKKAFNSLTEEQQDFFFKVFHRLGSSIEEVYETADEEQLKSIIGLIDRTLEKNKCGLEKKS